MLLIAVLALALFTLFAKLGGFPLAQPDEGRNAEVAREMGCDGFTTTLLISPQQKHELIIEVAHQAAREKGVPFLYADLRKRYSDSRHITKPMDLYRQQYCGCIYSKEERNKS